ISSTFREARMPSGAGVGGKVIATGAAAWVSNYLQARDVRHDEAFDDLVTTEGMVALLGVPLLVGEEVIGVLFAADRTERPFETDEVALLSAFADHAAVALNNARLYDESRSALTQLQDAFRTIEQQVAVVEKAQSVHESLTRVVLKGGGSAEIAQLLVEHLHGSVTVFDRAGEVIATCTHDDAVMTPQARPSPDPVEQTRQSGRWATITDHTGLWHSAASVQAGDTHLGVLLLVRCHEPSAVDVRTLERAAQITGLLILKETAMAEAEERVAGELLTELLVSTPPVGPSRRARARTRGIDIDALNVLLVAESDTRSTSEVTRRLHVLAQDLSGLAGDHLGRATLMVEGTDPSTTAREIHARLRRSLGAAVRVVAEQVLDEDWARAFGIASRCSGLLHTLGIDDRSATAAEYALFTLLFDVERSRDLEQFLHDTVGRLVEYDRRRSTHLVESLTSYYDNAGNLTRTAAALHVHINTLLKRLDRVDNVLGDGWRTGDRSLQLHVGLRLHTLRSNMG
ncbi:MAG: GAF domain-containing protein, partial [Rhodococcus sp. (in: high G+C Gram-positive bacteria)]